MENGGRFSNMRRLPEQFINDLKNKDGILNPLLERIKKDDTLLLADSGKNGHDSALNRPPVR